ncbi:MAG: fumarylacetoacetate hydrolase family protein [Thermomicrobiales bacterium]|nr:fumarylacetoacetate hydrolase family protein [Thermomicrobiales bacterium]
MKFLTYKSGDGLKLGVRTEAGVIDVAAAGAAQGVDVPASLGDVIAGGESAVAAVRALVESLPDDSGAAWRLDEMAIQYGPAADNPGKIICVGLNYARHAKESGAAIPTSPVLFSKFGNTICGAGDSVPLPAGIAEQYDYEVELGLVIGKHARNVSQEDALSHVFGYVTANDVSVRDLQMRTSQWLLGKTMDNFLPIGPYLVTADEVGDPQSLRLRCWVNDDIRQDSNTGDMIFSVAEIISYISRYFPLEPGDVIVTGTPEGVAMGREDKPWLKPGDIVTVEVERLGKLTNQMTA